jgi:hypothetical protein
MSYQPDPSYPVVGGEVATGYEGLAMEVERSVIALDGPAALPWERFVERLVQAARLRCLVVDVRRFFAPWDEIERRTARATVAGDPAFGRVFDGALADLFDELPRPPAPDDGEVVLLFGPGSALLAHDVLWYADVPKRLALAAVRAGAAANLGAMRGSEQRLLFVDWPPSCVVVGGSIARALDLLAPPYENVVRAAKIDHALLLGAALHATRST